VITLFLGGDVMTGRGVDQVLPHPGDPRLHESYMTSAVGYVELAESRTGPIPRPVDFGYVWGDALAELARVGPDVRIVNLETAVTTSDDHWPDKEVHYRMHPANIGCLGAAGIDCCALANNHVLDWGYAGLRETLETLRPAGIKTAGAGRDAEEAAAPAMMEIEGKGRVAVWAFGSESSGIPREWGATRDRPGLNLLRDLSGDTVEEIGRRVSRVKRPGTIVVASLHWGSNWGYRVPVPHRAFAHRLIEDAGVDVVHGHSSHHPRPIEVHRDRPILYGCGDLLTDYEGIGGYEPFRGELGLLYFPSLDAATGRLVRFAMTPTRLERFRLTRASREEGRWLTETLNREGRPFGARTRLHDDGTLTLE
jgi:poly-gamma-glutamate capsule biosynthesis protein CapA/YwtB (metallophosphatase superfamily)